MTSSHLGGDIRWLLAIGLIGALFLGCALVWWHIGPEIVLAAVVGGAALVVLMITPLMGVHILLMLIFFERIAVLPEGWTLMKVLAPLIMAAWLMNLVLTRRTTIRFGPFMMSIFAFVAWSGLSLFYASDTGEALERLGTLAQLAVAALMISSVLDSPRRIRQILWAVVIWMAVGTVIGFVNFNLGVTKVLTGPEENRNGFALFLDIAIICAFLLQQQTSSRIARLVLMFGLIPMFLLALAFTLSRAGWISLLVGVGLVWMRAASERRFLPVVAMMAILCVIIPFLPEAFWNRAGTILPSMKERTDTFGQRVDLWGLGLEMIQKHPVLGVGIGNFIPMSARYARGGLRTSANGAHNSYVQVAAETGLIGLVLFLWIHALALRSAARAIRQGAALGLRELRLGGIAVEVGILVMMVMALSGSMEGTKLVWVFLGMANSLGAISARLEIRRAAEEASVLLAPAAVPS